MTACCCDCEDLDEACDRWLKREQQRPDSLSRLAAVVTDRVRLPWLWGGARKLELSVVPPLVLLPALLHLASLHFLLGLVVLTALPALVLWYYYVTHRKKGRTLFFLSLTLFSLLYTYYLFLTQVFPRGDVSPAQMGVLTLGLVLTLAALIHSKREPGYVGPLLADTHSTVTYERPSLDREPRPNGHRQETVTVANRADSSEQTRVALRESGGRSWCSVCKVDRPPRAGHCRICGVCVLRLDHHCVWINSCVGQANHRSFLMTLLLFVVTSLYGVSLVLQSVCPRQNLLIALFYCPGVYNQHSSALCFTCAWYCSIVTGGILHLLVVQLINVSYNVTEREARIALRENNGSSILWGLIVDTGTYTRGFHGNWMEFFTMGNRAFPSSRPITDFV